MVSRGTSFRSTRPLSAGRISSYSASLKSRSTSPYAARLTCLRPSMTCWTFLRWSWLERDLKVIRTIGISVNSVELKCSAKRSVDALEFAGDFAESSSVRVVRRVRIAPCGRPSNGNLRPNSAASITVNIESVSCVYTISPSKQEATSRANRALECVRSVVSSKQTLNAVNP